MSKGRGSDIGVDFLATYAVKIPYTQYAWFIRATQY